MPTITVTDLFRPGDIEVPAILLEWQITENELESHLLELTRQYAEDFETQRSEPGDCVIGIPSDSSRETETYFFPGLSFPGVEEIEPLIGKKPGDQIKIRLGGREVDFTVQRILRRKAHALDDALVLLLDVPVQTLSDYIVWYRENAGQKKKAKVRSDLTRWLLGELAKRSFYNLDETALRGIAEIRLQAYLPPGEEVLDDKLREEMVEQHLEDIKKEAVSRYLCQEAAIAFTEEDFKEELESLSNTPGMDEMLDLYRDMLIKSAYMDQAAALLEDLACELMEGQS